MAYIGRQNLGGAYRQLDDISSGFDGSDTTHTMQVNSQNVTVGDVNQIILSIGGVIQKPGTDFTVSGSTLTFTTAPAANTNFFAILLGSDNGGTTTPTDLSVSTGKIAADAVTKAKLADSIDVFAGTSLNAADLGSGIHIKTSDSGASVSSDADDLIIENSRAGMSFLSATDNYGIINFGDSGDNNIGQILYYHTDNDLSFVANNTTYITIDSSMTGVRIDSGKFSTFGESAPDCGDGGITIQRGANDDNVFTFKSTDIAHGMTGSGDTDTFMIMTKADSTKGGVQLRTFAEDLNAERLNINVQGDGDLLETKSTSTKGAITFANSSKSGTGQGFSNSNGIIMSIANYTNAQFLFEADGNFHANAGSNTFDAYEDAQLARAYDLSHGKGVIESKFDKFVAYNHEKLAQLDLVGREEDGTPNHMVNVTGMQRLHNGAIWQQYEKHQRLAEAVYEMAKETLGEDKADAILEKHDIKLLN